MPASEIGFTSAGSKVFIALALPTAFTSTAFAALSWVEIGEVDNIPEFGKKYGLNTRTPLAGRIVRKTKTSINYGSVALQMARAAGDDGQAACQTAVDDDAAQSIKFELQDGTKMYVEALVMSYTTNIGGSESTTMATVELEFDSAIIEVPPT